MTTRFNYRDTLIKSFFERYDKDERHELYNLIKVYKLYKDEDTDYSELYETVEYSDIVSRAFWDNQRILERLYYLKNKIKLYDENIYDTDNHRGGLAYECEDKLAIKISRLYHNIEDWLVNHVFEDDVYVCPSCDEVRNEDDYDSDYDCCSSCADSRRDEEEEYYDEDEDCGYEHERYCKNYTYPVHDEIGVQCREDETVDKDLYSSKSLLYGVELEVMARNSMPYDFPETLHYNNDWFLCKRDGSLDEGNGGFEICTAPSTFKFLKDRFSQMFNSDYWTDENGSTYVKGWNTNCAGLHIHINKKALSPLEVGKLLVFVNDKKNARFIEDIAGRTMGRWCKSETKKISDGQYRSDDRYEAVNTVPRNTVELRIFKSNVSEHGFMRALEFTDGLIQYLKQSSIREQSLSYKSFISFIKKPENRSEYPNFWSWLITNGYVLGTPSRTVSRQFDNVSNG